MENYSKWMENNYEYLKEKTFFDILLPGTHDSGILMNIL